MAAPGSSDGSVDTTSVIDSRSQPATHYRSGGGPAGPEGLGIVPKAISRRRHPARLQQQEGVFLQKNGSLSILKIDGKKVTRPRTSKSRMPEAVMFTPEWQVHSGRKLHDPRILDP